MTKKERVKKLLLSIVFWGVLGALFIFFASLIILKANGYQLNWQNWKIIETGMIVLDGNPKDVDIKVNQKYLKSFPEQIGKLRPDTYSVIVSKSGYQSWQRNMQVKPGMAATAEDIVLFLEKPIDKTPSVQADKILNEYQNRSQDVKILESEIRYSDELISRFSGLVLAASLYPDSKHIVFQIGNELRAIDIDGTNNVLLANLDSSEPVIFTFRNDGKSVVYIDSGKIYEKIIR